MKTLERTSSNPSVDNDAFREIVKNSLKDVSKQGDEIIHESNEPAPGQQASERQPNEIYVGIVNSYIDSYAGTVEGDERAALADELLDRINGFKSHTKDELVVEYGKIIEDLKSRVAKQHADVSEVAAQIAEQNVDTPAADTEQQPEDENEKLPLRKRVGRKIGSFITRANIAITLAPSTVANGAKKAYAAYQKPLDKMKAKESDSRTKRSAKFIGRQAYRGVVGTGLLVAGAATSRGVAEAANITVNGHTGGMSNAFNDTVANSSMGKGQKNIPIRWSSEMGGLFPNEDKTSNQSVAEAVQTIDRTNKNNPGGNRFIGYSQGTLPLVEYFENHELKPDDQLVLVGGPYTPGQRLSDNPLVKIIEPAMKGLDINISQDTPDGKNVLYIVSQNDLVNLSKNNKNNPGDIINRIAGTVGADGHGYSSAELSGNTPHTVTTNPDGSTTWTLTQSKIKMADGKNAQSGIAAALANNGIAVNSKDDAFFQSIRGDDAGNWDTQQVVATGAEALNQHAPGAGDAVQQLYNTPGVQETVQQVADTYMDTQNNIIETVATVVQDNPQLSQAAEQAAPAVAQIVEHTAPAVQQAVKQAAPVLGQFGIKLP